VETPSPVAAQTLTLEQALRAAELRSRALLAQDAATVSAHEMAVAARQLPDPMLRFGLSNLPVDGVDRFSLTDDFMTMGSIGVMQQLTRVAKRKASAARFEREADAAQASRALQLANLKRDTAIAWFERYYQEQMLKLLRRQREEAVLQIEASDAGFRAGSGAQAEVFMARSAVAQLEETIRQAEARLANTRTELARWVGEPASQALGLPPPIDHTRSDDHSLDSQLERHPDIALMASRESVAQAEAEVARQEKHADWALELMYSQRGPDYSNMISLSVSVPLQWNQSNRQDREFSAKRAEVEQLRAEREELSREHLAQTRRWLQTWRSNLERLHDYQKSLIPLAGERKRAALAAYRGGRGSLDAVLQARRMEIDTRMEQLRIEMETAALWAQLEYLIPLAQQHGVRAYPHIAENSP
jgi:outer membrane protein TolC